MPKRYEDLRSARWFAPDDLRSMGHRSRAMQMGLTEDDWGGKPVIAIVNTWSDLSPCHHHLRDRAEWVKRGILQSGGMPAELPVQDFAEQMLKPTSMLYRNFGAMEVEETLRSHPVDGSSSLRFNSTPTLRGMSFGRQLKTPATELLIEHASDKFKPFCILSIFPVRPFWL